MSPLKGWVAQEGHGTYTLTLACALMQLLLVFPPIVCAENHVRTWTVTRFRGRISTQPGSTPIASFKVLSLEGAHSLFYPVNSIGERAKHSQESPPLMFVCLFVCVCSYVCAYQVPLVKEMRNRCSSRE